MAKFDFMKSLKITGKALQEAAEQVKNAAKDAKLPEVKMPDVKLPDVKLPDVKLPEMKALDMKVVQDKMEQIIDVITEKEKEKQETSGVLNIKSISTHNAIKIMYYLLAANGQYLQSEEEEFDAIGTELDPEFAKHKEQILEECHTQIDKVIDPEDYYDALQDGIEDALITSRTTADTFITPKLFVWNLLTIAYSDDDYDETERRLIKYVVRKLNIDKAVFLELENDILTLEELEKELQWIKTTDRQYLTIEAMVNEIVDRKNAIFDSVKDLIAL